MSELWSNIILSMLFWGFANQVTRMNEAKRFYGLFGIGANFSGVAAGQASVFLCSNNYNPHLPFGQDAWEQSLTLLISLVLISGIISIALFRWMHKTILAEEQIADAKLNNGEIEPQAKLSVRDSFAYLMRSKYLISIAVVVIAYKHCYQPC